MIRKRMGSLTLGIQGKYRFILRVPGDWVLRAMKWLVPLVLVLGRKFWDWFVDE